MENITSLQKSKYSHYQDTEHLISIKKHISTSVLRGEGRTVPDGEE